MSVWGHSGRIDTPATFAPCPLRSNRVRGSASQRNDAACQSRPSALKQKAPLFATSSASPNARDFAERDVMEYRRRAEHYSALMLADLITLPHFSVSSAMNLPKSAGEPGSGQAPISASLPLSLGSARPALISRFNRSTISAGVPFGAHTPFHTLASYPPTNS